jgi:YD repeat-containing protein
MSWLGWVLGSLLIAPAQAATHPAFLPAQDVLASYVVAASGRPAATYDLEYDAADQRARIVDPARGLVLLVDLPTGQAELVVPALHAVVEAPDISDLAKQVENADGAKFLALGPGHYADLACEKYEILARQGSGTACLTQDGVILHFAGRDAQGAASITAISVAMAHQPREDFATPDGYSRMVLPPGALAQLLGP